MVAGLEDVRYEELLAFDSGAFGIAFDLRARDLGAVLLAGASRVCEGDGVVDQQDYELWKANFGLTADASIASTSTAVPEPGKR